MTKPARSTRSITVAVDIGGTFTDLFAYDARTASYLHAKSPTTPRDLAEGILRCVQKAGIDLGDVAEVVHGSTVAINTVIEEKGARAALLVTQGTRDVYSIGRGNRPQAYSLDFRRPRPLIPRELTFEVRERLLADGAVDVGLDEVALRETCDRLARERVESVAVCLLHAYTNPAHEQRVGEILRERLLGCYVSLSHEILREYREYERMSTTAVNAYVSPVVSRYIDGLEERLAGHGFAGTLWIMQSNGGVMAPGMAARRPVGMMESGPVGGIIAAAQVGRNADLRHVIAFDMGGTTAKASLIHNGTATFSNGYYVGGYAEGQPVMSPVVDVVEVGTGGGSIAWIDDVGALRVGPRSAGAEPGPICYRRGGSEPTITDANVVLGRIRAESFMGGETRLDVEAALEGIRVHIAEPLGIDPIAAAKGIIEIADVKMSLAVREVSAAKGFDPREFAVVASGGAGPLHAVSVARTLHIPQVVVPRFPGHFSAVGMLASDQREDMVQTIFKRLDQLDPHALVRTHENLTAQVRSAVGARSGSAPVVETRVDMRYAGQDFSLQVDVLAGELAEPDLATVRNRFDTIHERRYGHNAPLEEVELVNLRVTAIAARDHSGSVAATTSSGEVVAGGHTEVYVDDSDQPTTVPVFDRDTMPPTTSVVGPALIQEYASTTVIFPGDRCTVGEDGDLIIEIAAGQTDPASLTAVGATSGEACVVACAPQPVRQ